MLLGRAAAAAAVVLLAACAAPGPAPDAPGVGPPPPPRREEAAPAVLGVVLSQSGSPYLAQYAELILEGVQVAVDGARARGARIELRVLDDSGSAPRAAQLVRELERAGAVAVIGPLLTPALDSAARARTDTALALVSPTASEAPRGVPNAYSLNTGDTRGAEALARYALRAGHTRAAVLYPRSADLQAQARVFAAALRRGGGRVVADVPYDSGTTTFAQPLRRIEEAQASVVFVPASERDVPLIAPQLAYYGLTAKGVQVLGNEAWAGEEVRRLVEPQYLNGVIAATPLYKPSPELGWQQFVESYEKQYRRTLTNPFPALGYDAVRLALAGLSTRPAHRAELARWLANVRDFRGATGVLSVEPGGALVRRPFLVRIQERELIPVDGG